MAKGQVMTSVSGYPRIGYDREWKKALEQYWAGKLTRAELEAEMERIELLRLAKLKEEGIDYIPVNDFSWYDHVLDMTVMFGLIPERFGYEGGPVTADLMFALARGTEKAVACEMTKWFNTNYHYIVPEWEGKRPVLTENRPLASYRRAKEKLGIEGKPVLVGPYTYVRFIKGIPQGERRQVLDQFAEVYGRILHELEAEAVSCVQLDEPAFVKPMTADDWQAAQAVYDRLRQAAPGLTLWVQTYFDSVSGFDSFLQLPVDVYGLDFVHGKERNEAALRQTGVSGREAHRPRCHRRAQYLADRSACRGNLAGVDRADRAALALDRAAVLQSAACAVDGRAGARSAGVYSRGARVRGREGGRDGAAGHPSVPADGGERGAAGSERGQRARLARGAGAEASACRRGGGAPDPGGGGRWRAPGAV